MKKDEPPLGEYWKKTKYSPLYQLYRRVEFIADEMRKRQKRGFAPLVRHVKELDAITIELKVLDKNPNRGKQNLG